MEQVGGTLDEVLSGPNRGKPDLDDTIAENSYRSEIEGVFTESWTATWITPRVEPPFPSGEPNGDGIVAM
jgi:hypothetical protein